MSQSIAFINPRVSTSNVGDYFIEDSIKRIIDYDPEKSVDIDPRKPLTPEDIEKINHCDFAIVVGTNLWYTQIIKENRWMISINDLKTIKIPFIPFGVGTTLHRGEDDMFNKESSYILFQIHSQCVESSVRDPRTFDRIRKMGITNVRMTGCPTLYHSLKSHWNLRKKNSEFVTLTVRKGQDSNVSVIVKELRKAGKKPIIAAQKKHDLFCARRRFPFIAGGLNSIYRFDIVPYLDLVEKTYGAIGWRLHGNMLHLAYGNPTMFFANCSRVRSFCEAFSLPCIYVEDGEKASGKDLAKAVGHFLEADVFADFATHYNLYYAEMSAFLNRNNITHHLTANSAT